ncbi:hypothetical protein HOLleu_00262 [Holothuria leucospilota]|uniref:Uncharacterized protein n=1 Tax=Holothuria leucospilota TaxID=206669 RepID=A0A9Q1HIL3_HOLLE|nr:hypothetical protein HOLleu_00262 [Holothuria leucospilota]
MTTATLHERNFQLTDQQRRECSAGTSDSRNSTLSSKVTFNTMEDRPKDTVWESDQVKNSKSCWKPNMLVPREGDENKDKCETVKRGETEQIDGEEGNGIQDPFVPTARPSLLTHRKRKMVNPLKRDKGEEQLQVGDGPSYYDIVVDVAQLEDFIKKKMKGLNDCHTSEQLGEKRNDEGKKKRRKREPTKKKNPREEWRQEGNFTHKQREMIQRWFDRSSVEVCIITYKASDNGPEVLNNIVTQLADFIGELKKCKSSFSVLYSNNKGEYEQQPGEKKKRNTKDKLNILIYTNVDRALHARDLNTIVKHATSEKINVVLVTLQEKLYKSFENHVNVTINAFEKFTEANKPGVSAETKLLDNDGTTHQMPTVILATEEETPIAETGPVCHTNSERESEMSVDFLQGSEQNNPNVDQLIEDIFGKD